MTAAEIRKDVSHHVIWCVVVYALVTPVACAVMKVAAGMPYGAVQTPLLVADIFAFVETMVVAVLWYHFATRHLDRLPTFYTATAGLRFMVVLAVLFVVCLVVGRSNMLPYVLLLLLYYIVILAMHSVFFARENNKLFDVRAEQ